METVFYYNTPIGRLALACQGGFLTRLYFEGETVPAGLVAQETDLLAEAAGQLQRYLAGRQRSFSLPLAPAGSEYMRRVWNQLLTIPYGETRSYRDIASALGNPQAARAVGLANNRNPLPLFIPCHRIVGSDRRLVGYRGGLPLKEHLLELERRGRVDCP